MVAEARAKIRKRCLTCRKIVEGGNGIRYHDTIECHPKYGVRAEHRSPAHPPPTKHEGYCESIEELRRICQSNGWPFLVVMTELIERWLAKPMAPRGDE